MKINVIGDTSVGKSALIDRLVTKNFEPTYTPTIAVDFKSKAYQLKDRIV